MKKKKMQIHNKIHMRRQELPESGINVSIAEAHTLPVSNSKNEQ
jgi:hypothetical protein